MQSNKVETIQCEHSPALTRRERQYLRVRQR
jgi:hypothetical protein